MKKQNQIKKKKYVFGGFQSSKFWILIKLGAILHFLQEEKGKIEPTATTVNKPKDKKREKVHDETKTIRHNNRIEIK